MKFLPIILFLLGCQTFGTTSKNIYETEEMRKYAELFEKYSLMVEPEHPTKITNLEIKYAKLAAPHIGMCSVTVSRGPLIELDPDYWAKATDTQKEVVLMHELAHCILRRDHLPDVNAEGVPLSIMYPNNLVAEYYLEAKSYYLHELFSIKNDWLIPSFYQIEQ